MVEIKLMMFLAFRSAPMINLMHLHSNGDIHNADSFGNIRDFNSKDSELNRSIICLFLYSKLFDTYFNRIIYRKDLIR